MTLLALFKSRTWPTCTPSTRKTIKCIPLNRLQMLVQLSWTKSSYVIMYTKSTVLRTCAAHATTRKGTLKRRRNASITQSQTMPRVCAKTATWVNITRSDSSTSGPWRKFRSSRIVPRKWMNLKWHRRRWLSVLTLHTIWQRRRIRHQSSLSKRDVYLM